MRHALAALLAILSLIVAPAATVWPDTVAFADDGDDGGDDDGGDDDGDDDGGDDGGASSGSGGASSGGGASGRDGAGGLRALFDEIVDRGGRDEVAPRELMAFGLTAADLGRLAQAGFAELSTEPLGALGERLVRLRAPNGVELTRALRIARLTAPSASFDFNHLYVGGGEGCAARDCWGAALIDVAAAPADACARGAPIAIIDTAVDLRHPTLRDADIVGRSFLSEDLTPAAADHGTAVAALLVGETAAPPLAPGAKLLAAAAFADRGGEARADAAAVIRSLDWSVAQGARVINLSLEGAPNALLARAVASAARRANLVASAGNGGAQAEPAYPAAYPEVLAVAAVDARKRPWRGGSRGAYVDVSAPGVDVVSAGPGGGLSKWTGTSFAAPFASAAMLRARAAAGGDPAAARDLLIGAAEDLAAPGRDEATGHGLVRAPGTRCW